MQRIGVVTDCVCDLPKKYLSEHGIDVIYFLIETDTGIFTDTNEITSENILGYMDAGGVRSMSMPPPVSEYRRVFEKKLERFDEIIFVTISSKISYSYEHAKKAVDEMGENGKRVHIFDSMHLSTGIGHIVVHAAEMAEREMETDDIIPALEELRDRVSTSFITVNADYLYRSGRVSETVKKLVDMFGAHPVLGMREGRIKLKTLLFGNYDKACLRYVSRELKNPDKIDKRQVFITQVGCGVKKIEQIKAKVKQKCDIENLTVTKASATISSSCGTGTFGILYIREDKGNR